LGVATALLVMAIEDKKGAEPMIKMMLAVAFVFAIVVLVTNLVVPDE
jgi:hypothetical protein